MTNEETEIALQPNMPIIAIGASAGGLEPIEAFVSNIPADAGWCIVITQHLSTKYRSMMDELLARKSNLAIERIENGALLKPNTIFLNPAGAWVTTDGTSFTLTHYPETDPSPHLPINRFFESLASCERGPAFGVILSGSGTDGTRGAIAIRASGGKVIVEDPNEADFESMPRSAIAANATDAIAKAENIPTVIAGFINAPDEQGIEVITTPTDPHDAIMRLLEIQYRLDFSSYKQNTVMRRIARRQVLRGYRTIEDYRNALAEDVAMLDELYQDLLIGVTEFYRDPDAYESLRQLVLPDLFAAAPDGAELRVWIPACATGEEAYSIAIELFEFARVTGMRREFRIIATDVHQKSIDTASQGIYPEAALEKLPTNFRDRYFVKHGGMFQINQNIRQRIIFSAHNALVDPPFMNLDLISCRNMMIYINDRAQNQLLTRFIFALRKGRFLFLGPSESLGSLASEFSDVDSKWRIFRKTSDKRVVGGELFANAANAFVYNMPRDKVLEPIRARRPLNLVQGAPEAESASPRRKLLAGYDALLKRYAPSSILINSEGEVLTWFGLASNFIDTRSNLADWKVEEIVHPDLQYAINVGIDRIVNTQSDKFQRRVQVNSDGEKPDDIVVSVEHLQSWKDERDLMLVVLSPYESNDPEEEHLPKDSVSVAAENAYLRKRVHELERDLRLTEESLQYVTESLEASGEELQASNEELQASNEELQASNEELQSSNEELHAVNEELVSITAEHERKYEILADLNADTEIIFEHLGVGFIVLDHDLRLRRANTLASRLMGYERFDTGRLLRNVGTKLDFVDLTTLAASTQSTGKAQTADGVIDGKPLSIRCTNTSVTKSPENMRILLIITGEAIESLA